MLMYKMIFLVFTLSMLNSCSLFSKRSQERKLQTKILQELSAKSHTFAACVRKHQLFKHFNQKRLKISLYLTLTQEGKVESFNLDNKNYPQHFNECLFNIISLIEFPHFDYHQNIELEQPFIFSQK